MNNFVSTTPLEPLLAGTLVLLHQQAMREAGSPPCPYVVQKLALNLHRLANHPAFSEPMSMVLMRLAFAWRQQASSVASMQSDEATENETAALSRLH